MARLDEIAEGIATVLRMSPVPEPLAVELRGESPVEVTVLIRAVIASCHRQVIPISKVRVDPELGKDLLKQLRETKGKFDGIPVEAADDLFGRVDFFRF